WGEGIAHSTLALADTAGQSNVTWRMWGKNDFISRIFGLFMNMDKAIGKDFEEGLANLQTVVASSPHSMPTDVQIEPGDYPGGKYLGVRATISMDQMEAFYSENLGKTFAELEKNKMEMTTMPTGIYYTWDMENKKTDMAAAVGFKGDLKSVPKGMVVLDVPASKSLNIHYMGGYHGLGSAHESMDVYMKSNNLEYQSPVLEEYLTDPGQEPDSMKWVTKITYLIKG
ncbi:MAG: GyrI-like domain-containing protein, partial [Nitrospira sp.]|nr:GyrI-like domain-containing protein [Nitrospira sp.]